jgi:hypothetical protein
MRLLCKCLRGALVWMTAVAVLFAGFPHYHCRCPDGRLKLLCFGWAVGTTGCCCGGACSPSAREGCCGRTAGPATGKPAKKAACCCHARPRQDGHGGDAPTLVGSSGCQKTLTQAAFVAVTAAPKATHDSLAAGPFLLPPSDLLPLPATASGDSRFTWHSYRAPPPTDLVITLLHLVI